MFAIERKQYIIELLNKNKRVYVSELSGALKVTEETIRRDLKELEKSGRVLRSHGGAVLAESGPDSTSFSERELANSGAKNAIAKTAAALIEDGMFLMVDTSTTAKAVISRLPPKKSVTILTNSYRLINDLSYNENLKFIGTGGDVRAHYQAFVGSDALRAISRYHADLALLGAHSVSREFGFMESNIEECDVKISMRGHCSRCVVVADSSKFDRLSKVSCLSFNDCDFFITDKMPSTQWQELFRRSGITVQY